MNLSAHEPIVVMGRGHSGTRVLTWICEHLGLQMGAHEDRVTADVDDLKFSRKIKKTAIKDIARPISDRQHRRNRTKFQRAVRKYHAGLGHPAAGWGWKFPETYLITPLIAETFPKAKYIHLIRDGRDLAFKDHLTDDPSRKLGRTILGHLGLLDEPHYIQAAVSWSWQVDRFDEDKVVIPEGQLLEMSFEKLCADTRAETMRLCAFLGLPMTDQAEAYISTQINRSKLSQHKEYDPEEIRAVEQRVQPTLQRYGYLS